MITCTFCRADLPTPSDQYGHPAAPVCLGCWLKGDSIDCPLCTYGHYLCPVCQGDGVLWLERLLVMANPNNHKLARTSHKMMTNLETAVS